ncbi:unnamed protein product, partial [Discosporangium mesarthrocarpum]
TGRGCSDDSPQAMDGEHARRIDEGGEGEAGAQLTAERAGNGKRGSHGRKEEDGGVVGHVHAGGHPPHSSMAPEISLCWGEKAGAGAHA